MIKACLLSIFIVITPSAAISATRGDIDEYIKKCDDTINRAIEKLDTLKIEVEKFKTKKTDDFLIKYESVKNAKEIICNKAIEEKELKDIYSYYQSLAVSNNGVHRLKFTINRIIYPIIEQIDHLKRIKKQCQENDNDCISIVDNGLARSIDLLKKSDQIHSEIRDLMKNISSSQLYLKSISSSCQEPVDLRQEITK